MFFVRPVCVEIVSGFRNPGVKKIILPRQPVSNYLAVSLVYIWLLMLNHLRGFCEYKVGPANREGKYMGKKITKRESMLSLFISVYQ